MLQEREEEVGGGVGEGEQRQPPLGNKARVRVPLMEEAGKTQQEEGAEEGEGEGELPEDEMKSVRRGSDIR